MNTSRRRFLTQSAVYGKNPTLAGTTVLLATVPGVRMLRAEGREIVLPPGSTVKPFVLCALLQSGKLLAEEEYACPGRLQIGAHQLNCSHPRLSQPLNAARAISYSCNCALAHWSLRFEPNQLPQSLREWGFRMSNSAERSQTLLALGEEGIRVTAAELLQAYGKLARQADRPEFAPIVAGLAGAVEFGTGQNAHLPNVKVAGKTGTVVTESGNHFAWFAGFAPSRQPEVVVTVLTLGRSGGSDAAPIAGRVLADYFRMRQL